MKKKILLFVAVLAMLVCLFALAVSAAEPSNSDEFGEVTLLDHADIAKRSDYGYAEGDTARVVLQIPGTNTYVTYPAYYVLGSANKDNGYQPTDDFSAINVASGYEFDASCIIRIEIPNVFNKISGNYFRLGNMTSLKYIKLGSNMNTVFTFKGNKSLETVVFDDNLDPEATLNITSSAFENCSALSYIDLPTHLTTMGERAFAYTAITSIDIPAKLDTIGTASFLGCASLETVNLAENNSITRINHRAFDECKSLTGTYVFEKVTHIESYAFRNSATNEGTYLSLSFPAIVDVGCGAGWDTHVFSYSGLCEIYLGKNLASMSYNNFTKCQRLWRAEFEGVADGFEFYGYTFDECTSLKAVSLPEGITFLPSRMFNMCTSLTAVYIPSTVKTIDVGGNNGAAFFRCTKLYFVNEPFTYKTEAEIPSEPEVYYFPSGITSITGEAFDNSRLNDVVVMPAGLATIPNAFTFEGCTSASGKPTVILLGDMTSVAVSGWNVNAIYFCNPADTDYASAGAPTDGRMVFCYAEGNTNHIKELSKATDATCTLPKMTADYCFCGQYIAGSEQTEGIALGHNYTGAVSYVFDSLITDGKQCTVCVNGCGIDEIKALGAVYTALGYSVKTFGTQGYTFVNGYDVNTDSLAKYQEAKGVSLEFGFAFNAANGFTNGDVTLDSFKIVAPAIGKAGDTVFGVYQYQMGYANADHLDSDLVIAAYVIEKSEGGEVLTFINRANGSVNGFDPISYNKALESAK